ncbi:MAG: extracellular solute-binding protein [Fidelibacterota bacterium]
MKLKYPVILAAFLFLLFQCGGKEDSSQGNVVLKYWPSSNPNEIALAKDIVKRWNETHQDIKVKMQPLPAGRSSEEILLAAIVGKTTPDISSIIWPGVLEQYIDAKAVIPLDQFPDFDSVLTSRIPLKSIELVKSSDGHFYQFPWKVNPIVFEYNVKRFRELGIKKPPSTYSEFMDVAAAVTRDTDGDGYIDQWAAYPNILVEWWQRFFDFYTYYIAASGGKTLLDDQRVIFDSKAGVEVFKFFYQGFRKGYFPNTRFQGDAFLRGKLAMHVTGPWTIAYNEKYKPEGFEYDFAPVPVPDDYRGPLYTYADPKNIVIFSTTRHPEEAWEFVKYLVSRENDKKLLRITNQMPFRRDMLKDEYFSEFFQKYPKYRIFAELIPNSIGVDYSIYLQEIFDIISQEFDASCIQGVKPPEKAVRDAADRVRRLIERERL